MIQAYLSRVHFLFCDTIYRKSIVKDLAKEHGSNTAIMRFSNMLCNKCYLTYKEQKMFIFQLEIK